MISLDAFRALGSANSWLTLIDAELPSPVTRTILDVLSGARPSPEAVEVWKSICDQPWPDELVTQALLQMGRGSLKSTIDIMQAIDRLLRFDAGPFVAPGSEVLALVCAPSKKQAAGAIRNALPIVEKVAELLGGKAHVRAAADATEVEFAIPGLTYVAKLVVGTADEATIRGGAHVVVIFDEAGWFPSGSRSVNTLADLVVAATPRVLQFPHGFVGYSSTNGPPSGRFYDLVQSAAAGLLKIGPVASWNANPAMPEARLRAELRPEEVSQEIECKTWGLRDAAFIPAGPAMACIDEEGIYTPKGLRTIAGGLVGFDRGGRDEIAYVLGYRIDVEIAPGKHVAHLVVEHAECWRPTSIPSADIQADRAGRLSIAAGGVPVLADVSGFVEVSKHLHEVLGFRVAAAADEEDRLALVRRGGKLVLQVSMTAEVQTRRWQKLRDFVVGGRLHLPDTEGGRELARELTTLRATQLASKNLRVDAQSGAEDGLVDCLSYIAGYLDSLPASSADGVQDVYAIRSQFWDHQFGLVVDGSWRRMMRGKDLGPGEPPLHHPSFAAYFASRVASGMITDRVETFCRSRLGKSDDDPLTHADLHAVVGELVRSGEIPKDAAAVAVIEEREDPMAYAMSRARAR